MTAAVIHRLELEIADVSEIAIPGFRRVLHVAEHRDPDWKPGVLEVWYERDLVTTDRSKVRFRVVGTGHPINFKTGPFFAKYVGSVVTQAGSLVWHVYVEYPIDAEVDQ